MNNSDSELNPVKGPEVLRCLDQAVNRAETDAKAHAPSLDQSSTNCASKAILLLLDTPEHEICAGDSRSGRTEERSPSFSLYPIQGGRLLDTLWPTTLCIKSMFNTPSQRMRTTAALIPMGKLCMLTHFVRLPCCRVGDSSGEEFVERP